ncbi:MAG: TetR/AcrR family transcriptional regulator [Pseudomonadota bacterium]
MTKKESILRAATRLFSEKGFKDTSMAELSRVTGAAEGTIFYHFKSKEELFVSILKDFKEDMIKEFERYLEERNFETGLDMVEGVISFYLHLAGTMDERFLLLHRHDAYELAKINSLCREYLEAIYNCLLDLFEQAVLKGQGDRSIGNMQARKSALIIFSMVDGLVRFNTYNLYDAGALYNEVITLCRRMLENRTLTPIE